MENNEKVFKELMVKYASKFPNRNIFTKAAIHSGLCDDDFIMDVMTHELVASVMECSNPKQTVYKTFPAPSFLDWLLRRKKTVEIEVDCKEIMVNPPSNPDNVYFYEARIKE